MRRRVVMVAIAVAISSYGCRLILGIGDAEDARTTTDGGPDVIAPGSDGGSEGGGSALSPCEGWCWENPLPQGSDLVSVWASSPTDIWAVGRDGATLHWDGTSFEVLTKERFNLRRVWAASGAEAFSLPELGTNAAVLRHDGGSWAESLHASTSSALQLFDVWGTGGDVWVVGSSASPPAPSAVALRLRSGGSTWDDIGAPWDAAAGPPMLQSIRGTGPNDVWASSGNRLAHWQGSWVSGSCEAFGAGTCNSQIGLVAEGPGPSSVLWLVSQDGTSLSFSQLSNGSWSQVVTRPYSGAVSAVAATKSEVWVMGQTLPATAVRLRGTELSAPMPLPDNVQYNALAPYGDHEVIAVGAHGAIARVEGDSWRRWPQTGGVYSNLADVCVADGLALAVGVASAGQTAVVLRRRDGVYTETSYGNEIGSTQSCWLASATEQWLVAQDIIRSNGKDFETVYDAPPSVLLRQIRGDAASKTIWAVGLEQTEGGSNTRPFAARFDGKTFVVDSPTDGKELSAVWIDPETRDAWAVGPGSIVLQHDGSGWHRIDPSPSPVTQLLAIGGSSNKSVWVAGPDLVARWNGERWEPHTPAPPSGLPNVTWSSLAVHGNDVWVNGPNAGPRRWDGQTWARLDGAPNLATLVFDRDGVLWGAGAEGAILRHGP